uniref:Uncharacterized protein n=1 Tax=Fagus sylvatica TaxID=28930 RepID=A0A2N9IJP0_FAGSY
MRLKPWISDALNGVIWEVTSALEGCACRRQRNGVVQKWASKKTLSSCARKVRTIAGADVCSLST